MVGSVFCTLLVAAAVLAASETAPVSSCSLDNIPVPQFDVKSLDPARFEALHRAVAPHGAGERWTEIPWQPNLIAARQRAAQEHKPILMWVMDGHPLGCT